MTQLPKNIEDKVKKEAERQARSVDVFSVFKIEEACINTATFALSLPVNGLRFIKASVKKSQHYVKVCCRRIDSDYYFTGYYDESVRCYRDNPGSLFELDTIEWLDESPSGLVEIEGIEERAKGLYEKWKGFVEECQNSIPNAGTRMSVTDWHRVFNSAASMLIDHFLAGASSSPASLVEENKRLREALELNRIIYMAETEKLKDELLQLKKEHGIDPYWYWPQCDVDECEGVSGYNGMGWRETGYWCLCSKHADQFRKGEPQPKMKDSSIAKEATRLPNGNLP